MSTRKPFSGSQRGLVVAFDLGTTFSGISFSVLDPGVVPRIQSVTRFPDQTPGGSSKIPSVLYYDDKGVARAIGAETQSPVKIEEAEDKGWIKVERFKMHLRPKSPASLLDSKHVPLFPPSLSLSAVLADYLRYLLKCVKSFIEETVLPDGAKLWVSVENRIIFVLSHPNGWEGSLHSSMRQAAVEAGLVTNADDQDRIHFVTEGKASLHFCVNNGLEIGENEGIIILDAGRGTIDLSAYSSSGSGETITFHEISRSECCFAGSVFVTQAARRYLEDKLKGTQFERDVDTMVEYFDRTTKLLFKDSNDPSFIKFGGRNDNDPTLNIRAGQVKIPGSDVARFFERSVKAALEAITRQCSNAPNITSVFLVGGFAASEWLWSQLKEELQLLGLIQFFYCFITPSSNKAVSDGAVSFHLDCLVDTRVSRSTYGLGTYAVYEANNPEHQIRGYVTNVLTGELQVLNQYSVILQKDVQILKAQEFRASFYQESATRLNNISVNILKYEGIIEYPAWTDEDAEMYSTACTVAADVSRISHKTLRRKPWNDLIYYKTEFDVILLFGLTELKAQIAWKEGNVGLSRSLENFR
ncbi:hypothetical protein BDP27DRAFT_1224550 [Rhodocollybia butyracea]|uniref:Uncharacterized protein n=1 Tax=Rhodocollybia butyracea TaxID=206335 RepID=A0A9P5U6Y6_9AGAR|nr:hypothetical protein BDP27DRAFT_1224550 [Rhodocollybia butyracea]